jgi:hypothetical protein
MPNEFTQIPLGYEIPQRLAHHPESHLLAVVCLRSEPLGLSESPMGAKVSTVRLVDDITFRCEHLPISLLYVIVHPIFW